MSGFGSQQSWQSMQNQLVSGQQNSQGYNQQNQLGSMIQYQGDRPEYVYCPLTNDIKDRFGNTRATNVKKQETNMITEVAKDLKQFIKDHKSTIYVIAALLLADHFMFNGAFKEKLKGIMSNLVGKVESKLSETKV